MVNNLYHYTHIDNLPYILKHNLLSFNNLNNSSSNTDNKNLKLFFTDRPELRKDYKVPVFPYGNINDYVQFYFHRRNFQIDQFIKGKIFDQKDMIFLEFPLQNLITQDILFTIGPSSENCYFYKNLNKLSYIDFSKKQVSSWRPCLIRKEDPTFIAQLSSSAYIKDILDIKYISRILVFNDEIKNKVESLVPSNIKVTVGNESDFFLYAPELFYESIIGPDEIYRIYTSFVDKMLHKFKPNRNRKFKNLKHLSIALNESLENLPETKELIGLQTFNRVHTQNVGDHTKTVVTKALATDEYLSLDAKHKIMVEVSAYLHDIGKGPKSRWNNSEGLQLLDPNHPIKSMHMLERIINEEICFIDQYEIKTLITLVCYHDLIGDITGKGRHVYELKRIIENAHQLNALMALSKGDIGSLKQEWISENEVFFTKLKSDVLKNI